MKRLALITLFFASGWLQAGSSEVPSGMVAATVSGLIYVSCRQITNDRFGCALGSIIITEFVMLWNISTSDKDNIIKQKMIAHTIGATISIPLAILGE